MTQENTYPGTELDALRSAVNYYKWITDEIQPYLRGHGLEVGAGYGTVSRFLLGTALQSLSCIEPDERLVTQIRATLQSSTKPVTIACATLEAFARVTTERFDSIVAINVLEHIADDQQALQQMHTLLAPNGVLCIYTPALPTLFGSLDVSFGHHRRYTRRRFEALIPPTGLQIEKLKFFNFIGILPWMIMGKLFRRRSLTHTQVSISDRFLIPLTRRLEKIVSPPIGQNLLLVARKVS
jgi:SAM-dependent methyltransferase